MKPLSQRQREVCVCLLLGMTHKQAGQRLGLSPRTIEQHLIAIRDKYEVRSTMDLLLVLWKSGEATSA